MKSGARRPEKRDKNRTQGRRQRAGLVREMNRRYRHLERQALRAMVLTYPMELSL